MDSPSSPAAGGSFEQTWASLVDRLKAGEEPLGERLYLLAAGPVPIAGAAGGAIALDRSGGVVLITALADVSQDATAAIDRQIEGLAQLPAARLREAGVDPEAGGGLPRRHAAFFGLDEPAELNSSQRIVVVLPEEPERETLPGSFSAVFVAAGGAVAPAAGGAAAPPADQDIVLEEPEAEAEAPPEEEAEAEPEAAPELGAEAAPELEAVPETEGEAPPDAGAGVEAPPGEEEEQEEEAAEAETAAEEEAPDAIAVILEDESTTIIAEEPEELERTGLAAWPAGNWIGLAMVLLGIVLVIVAINLPDREDEAPPAEDPNPEVRTVASGVVPDATHGRWIGQQRIVTLSDGTLAFAFPSEGALNIVTDEGTGGESWAEPFALLDVAPISLSVDVDSKDRLHIAYSDGAAVSYIRLKNKPAGWKPSRVIVLDDDTTSLNVDVAWDEQNQTAHVVWVEQSGPEGEAPAWAALRNEGGIHLTEQGLLADPGTEMPVLAAVAADGRSSLLVTYRRGDLTAGWQARYSPGPSGDEGWAFEEEEALPTNAFVGAADVVYDQRKTAHLVLRDSTNHALVYFTKRKGKDWSEGEVAHEGSEVQDVEFPTLSYSLADQLLYLFFQTKQYDPVGEVAYKVRDPETGWSEPFDIVGRPDAPEGALYPVTPDRVEQQALVLWTKTAETYTVDSAPVQPPP